MIRIGISGWLCPSWRGHFYPKGLPHRRELEFASRAFNTIEINGTFYSLKRPASFRRWHEETAGDFVFALKGSRFAPVPPWRSQAPPAGRASSRSPPISST